MAFDKTKETRLWGVTTQNSTVRMLMGDSSAGTFTSKANPLRGTLIWDDCSYVISKITVAGGATGGSYTVTVQTDAVVGYTGLPIARQTGIGPNSPKSLVLTPLHTSPGSPLPTHLFIQQTAAGGGLTAEVTTIAKQYRGTLGTAGLNTSERCIQGNLLRGASYAGGPFTDGKGIGADTTFTLGTSGTDLGMRRIRLWDRAFYWFVAGNSLTGTHDCNIVGKVLASGATFTIATSGTAGAMTAVGDKVAIASNLGGQSPNPTTIIWDVVSAGGVSDARVVVLAKTGRGSLAKE